MERIYASQKEVRQATGSMIITKTKTRTIEEQIVEKVLCNGCEKNIWNGHTSEGCRIVFDFEYGSGFDGQFLEGHLCDDCFVRIKEGLKLLMQDLYD